MSIGVQNAETPTMEQIAVSIPEAAKLIGIGRTSLYKLFDEGVITPRKSGRRTLILVEDLRRYAQSLPGREAA